MLLGYHSPLTTSLLFTFYSVYATRKGPGRRMEEIAKSKMAVRLLRQLTDHPAESAVVLVLLSFCYDFARILVLQAALSWIHNAVERRPLPFIRPKHIRATLLGIVVVVAWTDASILYILWRYLIPSALTLRGRMAHIVGVPIFVAACGVAEVLHTYRHAPSAEASTLSNVEQYFQPLIAKDKVDADALRVMVIDTIHRQPSSVFDSTVFAVAGLVSEVGLVLFVTCAYSICVLCHEPKHDGEELREAVRNNDNERVKLTLARGVNVDDASTDGTTALHIGGQQALPTIVKLLLCAKANPNVTDRIGFTPLHWAVQVRREEVSVSNRLDVIRLLLEYGADPKLGDARGVTAAVIASKKENVYSLEVLKEVVGDDLGIPNENRPLESF